MRSARVGAVLALAMVAVLPLLAGPAAAPSYAAPVPALPGATPSASPTAPNDDAPIHVAVTTLLPRAPAPGGVFEVAGTLTNRGDKTVTVLRVRLAVGGRVIDRDQLRHDDLDRPETVFRAGTEVKPVLVDLVPGQTTTFDLRTRVSALGLEQLGVYPLDVVARGVFDGQRSNLGLAATWIPWFAGDPVKPTRVAVLWPLVDQPRSGPRDVLVDDELATALAPNGRLGQLLAGARGGESGQCDGVARGPVTPSGPAPRAAPPRPAARRCEAAPVTFAVDPDLLFTVQAMTKKYAVQAGNRVRPGTGTVVATRWLAELRAAVSTTEVLALPYADPDVDALTRDSRGKNDVAVAEKLGGAVVKEVTGATPLPTVAWPPSGTVSSAAMDALSFGGTTAVVLDPSAFDPPTTDLGHTPGARAVLPTSTSGERITGLVVDRELSDLLTSQRTAGLGPRLAEQRWLAETAIVAAERPGSPSRTMLLAPPRRGDVPAAVAAAALRDLGRLPWLCPVPLADVAAGREHCSAEPAIDPAVLAKADPRGDARIPPGATELSPDLLTQVARDRDSAVQLVEAVLKPSDSASRTNSRLRRAVARAESSAWRAAPDGDPAAGRRLANLLTDDVADLIGHVKVRGKPLLLTSSKGTLSVSVENTLDVPIALKVKFFSSTATLSTQETGLIEVRPGTAQQASVRAATRTSGRFVVFAQLMDRNGHPFEDPAEVDVRSTRYGRIALAVTGLAAGVLLAAAGARIIRRALRRRPA